MTPEIETALRRAKAAAEFYHARSCVLHAAKVKTPSLFLMERKAAERFYEECGKLQTAILESVKQ